MDTKTTTQDDLEAVRTIATTLAPFKKDDQERIIRWAREKVGLSNVAADSKAGETGAVAATIGTFPPKHDAAPVRQSNIKQFVEQKAPKSDMHFATVVAYYHRFNAPEGERKNTVTAEDLQDACRKADRERLKNPGQTLINAFTAGLLDRENRGEFGINSVGENLVAMALPEAPNEDRSPKKRISKPKSKPVKRTQKRK